MKTKLGLLLFMLMIAVGCELQAQDTSKPALRAWKDSTGQFSIQATFVRVNGDQVVLQGIDKKEISLSLTKLSTTDQQYVKARLTSDPAALVDRFGKLNAAEQTKLSEAINGNEWRQLNPEQRLALQKAAVSYSERVLGRDEKGNLKVIKSETGKQLLGIAGDYLHKLPPGEVPAHGSAQAIYGGTRNSLGQACKQSRHACNVTIVFAGLIGTTIDEIVHDFPVKLRVSRLEFSYRQCAQVIGAY